METSSSKKDKKHLFQGPVPPEKIAQLVAHHQTKTGIGAHSIFLGQVRADLIDGKKVASIRYSAYDEMAEKELSAIREEAFSKFPMPCMHIYHSVGELKAGEVSLVVMTSSAHRAEAIRAMEWVVEEIKKRVPVWKQEVFEDGSVAWVAGN